MVGFFVSSRLNSSSRLRVEKQNPRKGTETSLRRLLLQIPVPCVEKQNPRKGTETVCQQVFLKNLHFLLKNKIPVRGRKLL